MTKFIDRPGRAIPSGITLGLILLGATAASALPKPPHKPPAKLTPQQLAWQRHLARQHLLLLQRQTAWRRAHPLVKPRSVAVRPRLNTVRVAPRPRPAVPNLTGTGPTGTLDASAGLADERLLANRTATPLSLEDAIATALLNNPQRAAAQASVRAAQASIGIAKAAGGLQADLSGNASRSRNDPSSPGSLTGTTRGELLSADASVPLYTGGRVKASTRVAQFNTEAQIAQERQIEQDLVLNTTLAYLNILRSEQLLDVANSNLQVSTERLRVATVRYVVGASARLDVLQARTDLADARQRRITASNDLGQANASFNTLLGRAPETPVRVNLITSLVLPPEISTALTGALGGGASGSAPNVPATTNSAPLSGAATGTTTTTGTTTGTTATTASAPATTTVPVTGTTTTGIGTTTTGTTTGTTTTGTTTTGATGTTTTGTTAGTTATGTSGAGSVLTPSAGTGATATTGTTGSTVSAVSAAGSPSAGLQTVAGASRQSLAIAQAQLNASQANLELAQAQRRPSIGLSLTALLHSPASVLGYFGTAIGLGLGQTLFDSGRIRSQVEQARAIVEQNRQNVAGLRLDVANSIEASLLNLDSAQRRLTDADAGVISAREALRIAQLGFRNGVRTTLDISSAQAALLAAATDAVNARFDVATAQAQLASTVGIYTVEEQAAYQRATNAEQARQQAAQQATLLAQQPKKKKRHKFLGIF